MTSVFNKFVEGLLLEISKYDYEADKEKFCRLMNAIMEKLYHCPCIYVAISHSDYSPDTMTSTPLISTKDGAPALYVFTSPRIANAWCEAYEHDMDGVSLFAEVRKEDRDFRQLFQIAYHIGAKGLMINEGSNYIMVSLREFLMVNGLSLDTLMLEAEEEVDAILNGEDFELVLSTLKVWQAPDDHQA